MSFLLLASMVEMRETVRSNSALRGVIEGGTAGNCFAPYLNCSRHGFVLSGGGGVSVEEIGSGDGKTLAMLSATSPLLMQKQVDGERPRLRR